VVYNGWTGWICEYYEIEHALDSVLELGLGLALALTLYCTVLRWGSLKAIPPAWMKRDKINTF
jgi:hypothetical protein